METSPPPMRAQPSDANLNTKKKLEDDFSLVSPVVPVVAQIESREAELRSAVTKPDVMEEERAGSNGLRTASVLARFQAQLTWLDLHHRSSVSGNRDAGLHPFRLQFSLEEID